MKIHKFTEAENAALNTLRNAGFAVAVFTPEESEGKTIVVDTRDIEEAMVTAGNEAIAFLLGDDAHDE